MSTSETRQVVIDNEMFRRDQRRRMDTIEFTQKPVEHLEWMAEEFETHPVEVDGDALAIIRHITDELGREFSKRGDL